jgi:cysteinyl-tRNA synthetase
MKIYNSLTGQKQEFIPLDDKIVNMYTCGVTVYDQCHIGHARSLYIFNVIRSYLEYKGYRVNFVRNITDIDDKIINRANELDTGWKDLVEKYISSYNDDLKALGIRQGILDEDGQEPRATKSIGDIIQYISVLMEKGYAYESGGDVYFEVRRFPGYGKLSGQDIEKMRNSIKPETGHGKRDMLDFALWKKSKQNEPSWNSPWGNGRPGWHIECSVMSQRFLKTSTLDIHAGGRDLVFPHHENEIAQSESYTGKPFARYWIHHGLLTINNAKMSKSSGNFITIKHALERYRTDALKILFLQAHYSSPVDFSEARMHEADAALKRFHVFFDKAKRVNTPVEKKTNQGFKNSIDRLKQGFIQAMDDDFNTPQALSKLFEIVTVFNTAYENDIAGLDYAGIVLEELSSVLGLDLKVQAGIDQGLRLYIKRKIEERTSARKKRDFKQADSIRDELEAKGIAIEDTREGTIWRMI